MSICSECGDKKRWWKKHECAPIKAVPVRTEHQAKTLAPLHRVAGKRSTSRLPSQPIRQSYSDDVDDSLTALIATEVILDGLNSNGQIAPSIFSGAGGDFGGGGASGSWADSSPSYSSDSSSSYDSGSSSSCDSGSSFDSGSCSSGGDGS